MASLSHNEVVLLRKHLSSHGIGSFHVAFSSKDMTKVDRSGAYIARELAVKYLLLIIY